MITTMMAGLIVYLNYYFTYGLDQHCSQPLNTHDGKPDNDSHHVAVLLASIRKLYYHVSTTMLHGYRLLTIQMPEPLSLMQHGR